MKSIKDIFKKHLNAFLSQHIVSKSEFKKAFERAEKEVLKELETNWQKIENLDMCDDDEFDYNDYEDYEEQRLEQIAGLAISCKCGAWQFSKDGQVVHVSDCVCGAE